MFSAAEQQLLMGGAVYYVGVVIHLYMIHKKRGLDTFEDRVEAVLVALVWFALWPVFVIDSFVSVYRKVSG